jgi:hypothetical protein
MIDAANDPRFKEIATPAVVEGMERLSDIDFSGAGLP